MKLLSRILLASSALVFAFGTWMHTSAFGRMSDAVAKSDLPPFFGNGFRTLWLQDSVIQIVFAIIFGLLAIRPAAATRFIVVILGLLPITTAVFIYHFIGNFVGGHIFVAGGLTAILGGLFLSPRSA
jgi:hypothetical protein